MIDLSNYYEREPIQNETETSERFPRNHVKYSSLLDPLIWIDKLYRLVGSQAFKSKEAMLKEFDSAAPLDESLGTKEELMQTRKLLISFWDGIDKNPFLSVHGRFLLKKSGLGMLRNRKKVLQFYHSNRTFVEAQDEFKSPLIITGSARSGTTLLQRLLSEDQNTRSPYTFELEHPIPPLGPDSDPLSDPRIKKSGAGIKMMKKLAPGFVEKFAESHLWSATEMEESVVYALAHHSLIVMNCASSGKSFMESIVQLGSKRSILRYEHLFFTILNAFKPPRTHWILKAPDYSIYFPLVFEEYQDANIVITHRNPLITLPSLCRIMESWSIAFDKDGTFDKYRFGKIMQLIQDKYCNEPLSFRKSHPEYEDRIFDCMYDEFFTDPIATVKNIYQKFDLEYTKEFEERMIKYLQNNKQGKYGRHKYSLEEYGFDAEHLYNEFKEYMDHYGFEIPIQKERPTSFDFLKGRGNV